MAAPTFSPTAHIVQVEPVPNAKPIATAKEYPSNPVFASLAALSAAKTHTKKQTAFSMVQSISLGKSGTD